MADADAPVPERLLDAALEVAAMHGLNRLAVGDVAKRAGLSRPTLYRHFAPRDELVAQMVRREAGRIVEQVIAAAERHDDPFDSLYDAILTALHVLRGHPLLDRLLTTEPESLLPLLTTEGSPAMSQVRAVVELLVAERAPAAVGADPVALRRFADVVTRLIISYAVSAPDDPPEVVAHYLSMFLIPDVANDAIAAEATR